MFVDTAVILPGGRLDVEAFNAGAVDEEFDVVRAGDAFDVFVAVTREADLHFVFGIHGEGVAERFAAPCA